MLLVLALGLVEVNEAMAFAPEEIQRVQHGDAVDAGRSRQQQVVFRWSDAIDSAHHVNGSRGRFINGKHSDLPVGGGVSLGKGSATSRLKIFQRGPSDPNVTILGSERKELIQPVGPIFGGVKFRPEVHCLAAFQKIRLIRPAKFLKKRDIVEDMSTTRHHRPTTWERFEILAFLKKSAGKIEFSRCRTAGLSPPSKRKRSSLRAAFLAAARESRLALAAIFMRYGGLLLTEGNGYLADFQMIFGTCLISQALRHSDFQTFRHRDSVIVDAHCVSFPRTSPRAIP